MDPTTNARQSPPPPDSRRGPRPSAEGLPVFATGRLLDGQPEDIRQAVVLRRSDCGRGYDAVGENGTRYVFAPDWLHVPRSNLSGSTLDFALALGVAS